MAEANQRSGAVSGESIAQAIWQDVWRRHGVLPLDTVPSTLERVRNLEALGTVCGRWGGTALGTVGGRWGGGDASQPQIDRQNLASGMIIVPWGRCVEAALDGHCHNSLLKRVHWENKLAMTEGDDQWCAKAMSLK